MQALKRPMPVGIEDFKKLVTGNYYFIDKTRFIKELIDTQGEVTLITRPRRFGKTLSLSMLQYFFTNENAKENRKLFSGLDIERAGDRYMQEQGNRPVVFLTLKEVRARKHDVMMDLLARTIQELCGRYQYLLSDSRLPEKDKDALHSLLSLQGKEADLRLSLGLLMRCLEAVHGKKPVLLLDEYDAPILSAWENGYYQECMDFMRGFLGSALKTNPALGFAVLTGITRISKESIFSGLNNLDVCGVLTELYNDAMGFTQEEAAKFMADCGQEDKLPELAKWYDGYRFGQAEIYNPWSVINFVQHGCKFQRYWINVSGNSILQVLLKNVDDTRYEELQSLLRFREAYVDTMMDEGIIYPDIETDDNALYMMLLTTGYLKAIETWQDRRGRWWCRLQIPNREVLLAYEDEVLAKVAGPSNRVPLFAMLNAMTAGKASVFQKHLSKILRDMVSYHDTAQPESFYHGLMLGLTVLMEGEYRVESNRESGYGRFDLAFFPLHPGTPGVILELKAAGSEAELEEKAREALQQIAEKEYCAELSRQGVKDIWHYGIAFHGKKVKLKSAQD